MIKNRNTARVLIGPQIWSYQFNGSSKNFVLDLSSVKTADHYVAADWIRLTDGNWTICSALFTHFVNNI